MFLYSPRKFQVNKFIDFIDDDIYNLFKFGYFSFLKNMTQQACFLPYSWLYDFKIHQIALLPTCFQIISFSDDGQLGLLLFTNGAASFFLSLSH